MTQKTNDEWIAHFEDDYGPEGGHAYECLCLTAAQANAMSLGELNMKVQHALQDMGLS